MAKVLLLWLWEKLLWKENESLDQKSNNDFFPELKGKYAKEVTIGDLSSMASGLSWDEKYYSPFSIVTRAYFDDNLKDIILGLDIKRKTRAIVQIFKWR